MLLAAFAASVAERWRRHEVHRLAVLPAVVLAGSPGHGRRGRARWCDRVEVSVMACLDPESIRYMTAAAVLIVLLIVVAWRS